MTPLTLRDKVVAAIQAAGATEEMVAGVVGVFGEFGESPPRKRGRRRQYADHAARQRAYEARHRRPDEKRDEIPAAVTASDEKPDETDGPTLLEALKAMGPDREEGQPKNLRVRLIDASNGNMDALSDIAPIRGLIEQGCDLEADVLPIVARMLPELPRPLKNWGAPWLVRDILAARDQRLSGHAGDSGSLNETAVEAPPPVQRTPASHGRNSSRGTARASSNGTRRGAAPSRASRRQVGRFLTFDLVA
jgi:hypothetical protein